MRKLLAPLLKIALSLGLVAYLLVETFSGEGTLLLALHSQPKRWGLLAAAGALCLIGLLLALLRWWWLLWALDVPCRLRDALRVGMLASLLSLAPTGIVGGDILRVGVLARQYRGSLAAVLASVAVDRLVGLYTLFLCATFAILVTGFWMETTLELRVVCLVTTCATAAATLLLALMLWGLSPGGQTARILGRLPYVGGTVGSLVAALAMYRRTPRSLAVAVFLSVISFVAFVWSIDLIARGLSVYVPPLRAHIAIVSISITTNAIPLPLGPFEMALEFLYAHGCVGGSVLKGQGLLVALVSRLVTLLVAAAGAVCALSTSARPQQAASRPVREADTSSSRCHLVAYKSRSRS